MLMGGHPKSKRAAPLLVQVPPICLALALGGCAVGPDFLATTAPVQDKWIESGDKRVAKSDVKSHWWKTFKDPTLDRLIQRAYEQNLPVRIAGLKILEARAQLGVAIGNLYPQTQEGAGAAQQNRGGLAILDG